MKRKSDNSKSSSRRARLARQLDTAAPKLSEVEPAFRVVPKFETDEEEAAWLDSNYERLADLTLKDGARVTAGAQGADPADFHSPAGAGSGAGQADRRRTQGELSERA